MPDLNNSFFIAAAGMRAQSTRIRVVAENIANADSLSATADGQPYRRKVVTFQNVLDRTLGVDKVGVKDITRDPSEFSKNYDPSNPHADDDGYVLMPNVNTLVEMMDMREAQRSYQANLNVIEVTKAMLQSTMGILRA